MKRILILTAAFTLLFVQSVFGAGAMTGGADPWVPIGDTGIYYKTVTFTDDTTGTTGTITMGTNIALFGAWIYCATTDPGTTAPTDNYDIVVSKANGVDVFGGNLMNRDTANTETAFPASGYEVLDGNLTFTLSNNAVNNATGTLTIYALSNKE